jgi:MFS family permease
MTAWMSHCPALRRPWFMNDQTAKEKTQMETRTSSAPQSAPRNLNLALAVIALAQLMVVLDTAIVNVALPSIQRALHFNPTDLEWVVNAYTIAFGGLLLLGGRTGDLFGRRRMFIIGALLFTAGSLAGGLANSSTFLIIARAAQGVGGAILAPTALSLLAQTFTEGKERNRAFGVYSAVSAGGGAVGLLLGGIITNYFSWRWVMFVNVPIGLLLAFASPRVLVRGEGRPGRLDLPGALTVSAGAMLLVYGLSRAAVHGWSDSTTLAALVVSAVLLVAFGSLPTATGRAPMRCPLPRARLCQESCSCSRCTCRTCWASARCRQASRFFRQPSEWSLVPGSPRASSGGSVRGCS